MAQIIEIKADGKTIAYGPISRFGGERYLSKIRHLKGIEINYEEKMTMKEFYKNNKHLSRSLSGRKLAIDGA